MRVQSPSSIKTYKHCPRKYFYQYIAKLPTVPNIHQIRGNIVHAVLEKFFQANMGGIDDGNFPQRLHLIMQDLLVKEWKGDRERLDLLGMSEDQYVRYFEDSMSMLSNWLHQFCEKIRKSPLSFPRAWAALVPREQEQHYQSQKFYVRGFIDAVEEIDGQIRVMDYKTDKDPDIEKHRLQLAIYALLYKEKHGTLPDKSGIYFLKGGEQHITVDEGLVEFAKREIAMVHEKTQSLDKKTYPKNITPLCKWSTGQCDFYDTCFNED